MSTDIYVECKHIKRTKPDAHVTEEIAKEIGSNYRTFPVYEKGVYEYIYLKHYSLKRNELLRCKWAEYKRHVEGRVFAPFQFPSIRDLHFYKGSIRFQPSQSIHTLPEHRMKLKPGPGVDARGQMPIPQEMIMKRGNVEKHGGQKTTTDKKKRDE